MKKFLSLVLALVMTMSLVTVSAGAAEYKDLTDKDEIQYEEAVAVLNRLGIITGYSDGSFQPKTELTRGAAAKIIVSLLIGPEAAGNLVAASAPYSDVPVDHTFAGVISYCKTSKIIDGYTDGTFRPLGTLSGFAFSKMLLGALGYKGEYENGFTGSGWTMNVARLGNAAGLFDRLSFKGNEAVNREQACQLALNTLKATTVEYTGGLTVTAGDASVVGAATRNYVTSNNRDFALNISSKSVEDGWWTVEFGEEHFVDLRLEHDKRNPTSNDMGQPSAEWSYKKVTIGTYALEPDYRYTELVAHYDNSSTDASRVRALGLGDYKVNDSTQLWLNGYPSTTTLEKVGDIAKYTDNGTVVEVYISENTADLITDVVVIQSALMEVKRVGSDYVTIGKYDTDGSDTFRASNGTDIKYEGYNRDSFDVVNTDGLVASKSFNDVQIEDRGYEVLSGLKAGDKVVIVPVSDDRSNATFNVWEAYVPEEVTGTLTRVDNYGSASTSRGTIGLTVGGTAYKAAEWNKDIIKITGEDIKVTKKDVTLTLDKYGNALLAEDVGATKEYMVVGNYYRSLESGRLVAYVHGWDMDGNEVDLNLGSNFNPDTTRMKPGDLVRYVSNTTGSAEWVLQDGLTTDNPAKIYAVDHTANSGAYQVTAYNTKIVLTDGGGIQANEDVTLSGSTPVDFASGIKFVYVEFNDDDEVESVEIRKGVQAASNAELKACHDPAAITNQYVVNDWNTAEAYVGGTDDDGDVAVKAVVIKRESNTAISSNLLYIRDYLGSAQKSDSTGKIIYGYTVVMNTADGLAGEAKTIYSYENLSVGDFASYAEVQNDQVSDFYKLREHTSRYGKTTTTFVAEVDYILASNNNIIVLDGDTYKAPDGSTIKDESDSPRNPEVGTIVTGLGIAAEKQTGEVVNRVRVSSKTQWVDLTPNHIASTKDLKDFTGVKLAMVVNDNVESDGFRDVAMIIVQDATRTTSGGGVGGGGGVSGQVSTSVRLNGRGEPVVEFTVTRPDWAADDAEGEVHSTLFIDGVQIGTAGSFSPAQNATNATSKVSQVADGKYADSASDVQVKDISVTWNKARVVASGSLPTGISIAPAAQQGTAVEETPTTGTVKLLLANSGDSQAKPGTVVIIKQGEDVLLSNGRITAANITAGYVELTTSGNITAGNAVSVIFQTCTCETQCSGTGDSECPVCNGESSANLTAYCQGAATYDVTVTNIDASWQMKGAPSLTGKSSGDTVTFVLQQKTGATTTLPVSESSALAAAKVSITGLPEGTTATAYFTKAGKTAVTAVPATDEFDELTVPSWAGTEVSESEITELMDQIITDSTNGTVNSSDGKLYYGADESSATVIELEAGTTSVSSVTGGKFYAKLAAGATVPGEAAEQAEITISLTMPESDVAITGISINLNA